MPAAHAPGGLSQGEAPSTPVFDGVSYARAGEITSLDLGGGKGASGTHLQKVQQGRDVRDLAEVVDDLQACVDLLITELGARHQRAILSLNVGPGNPKHA
jgi:hypothetical protein